jgi:hypothetical protein
MDVEQAKTWAKTRANQDRVVHSFFDDNKPKENRVAFFMAGVPGAGKTEFTERTILEASPDLVSVEHDKQGEPDMKKATAIIHSSELDKSSEIEKALRKNYYNIDTER